MTSPDDGLALLQDRLLDDYIASLDTQDYRGKKIIWDTKAEAWRFIHSYYHDEDGNWRHSLGQSVAEFLQSVAV